MAQNRKYTHKRDGCYPAKRPGNDGCHERRRQENPANIRDKQEHGANPFKGCPTPDPAGQNISIGVESRRFRSHMGPIRLDVWLCHRMHRPRHPAINDYARNVDLRARRHDLLACRSRLARRSLVRHPNPAQLSSAERFSTSQKNTTSPRGLERHHQSAPPINTTPPGHDDLGEQSQRCHPILDGAILTKEHRPRVTGGMNDSRTYAGSIAETLSFSGSRPRRPDGFRGGKRCYLRIAPVRPKPEQQAYPTTHTIARPIFSCGESTRHLVSTSWPMPRSVPRRISPPESP